MFSHVVHFKEQLSNYDLFFYVFILIKPERRESSKLRITIKERPTGQTVVGPNPKYTLTHPVFIAFCKLLVKSLIFLRQTHNSIIPNGLTERTRYRRIGSLFFERMLYVWHWSIFVTRQKGTHVFH